MAMHTWFICKVSYEKVAENGMNKKVTEPYLVDALSFTEAEARIIEEITPFISGEFTVSDVTRANFSELFSVRKMLPTVGINANSTTSPSTKRAVLKNVPLLMYWYRLPIFAMLLPNSMKE